MHKHESNAMEVSVRPTRFVEHMAFIEISPIYAVARKASYPSASTRPLETPRTIVGAADPPCHRVSVEAVFGITCTWHSDGLPLLSQCDIIRTAPERAPVRRGKSSLLFD